MSIKPAAPSYTHTNTPTHTHTHTHTDKPTRSTEHLKVNLFPLILEGPPSLILNLDFGGLVLILGGFPAPTGMTGITVIRL